MDRESVKKSQVATINKALLPRLKYFLRLRKRMEQVGFPQDDKLYLVVSKVYDAVYALHMETHYFSCDGVGNPPTKGEKEESAENYVATQIDSG